MTSNILVSTRERKEIKIFIGCFLVIVSQIKLDDTDDCISRLYKQTSSISFGHRATKPCSWINKIIKLLENGRHKNYLFKGLRSDIKR